MAKSEQRLTVGWIMVAILVWGLLLAVGSFLFTMDVWGVIRGAIIMVCVSAFVGGWFALTKRQARRSGAQ